jgi:putative FmdB family regulatory protein
LPLYEYFCPPCGSKFEVLRPVSQMDQVAVCPDGHTTNNRVLSVFAPVSKAGSGINLDFSASHATNGGACCGGSCSCC